MTDFDTCEQMSIGLLLTLSMPFTLYIKTSYITSKLIICVSCCFFPQIMTVYHPHHVDIDKRAVLNGSRFTSKMYASKFTPREPCDTTVSTLTQSVSHAKP